MIKLKRRDGKPLAAKGQMVQCSLGCKGEFPLSKINPLVRVLDEVNGVGRTFFQCPLCKHEYTMFYEDKQCRIWQGMKKGSSPDFVLKLQERIDERMQRLKEKYEVE